MLRTISPFVLVALALGWGVSPARGDVLYAQTPAPNNGFISDFSSVGEVQYADDFTLASPATLTSVTWRGAYAVNSTPSFPLRFNLFIYGDNGNLPDAGAVLSTTSINYTSASQVTDTGLLVLGEKLWEFTAPISPLELEGGTRYWFSPYADTSNDSDDTWYWTSSHSEVPASVARRGSSTSWTADDDGDFYFVLNGTVPEPVSLAIPMLGFLAVLRRRR